MSSSRLEAVTQAFITAKKKMALLRKKRIAVLQKDEANSAESQIAILQSRIKT